MGEAKRRKALDPMYGQKREKLKVETVPVVLEPVVFNDLLLQAESPTIEEEARKIGFYAELEKLKSLKIWSDFDFARYELFAALEEFIKIEAETTDEEWEEYDDILKNKMEEIYKKITAAGWLLFNIDEDESMYESMKHPDVKRFIPSKIFQSIEPCWDRIEVDEWGEARAMPSLPQNPRPHH